MPISTYEKNKNILKKICNLAKTRQVNWTGSANQSLINESLTPDDVLDAIVSHIEGGGDVKKNLTRKSLHTGKVIFEMLSPIGEKLYYIKVQLWGKKGVDELIVISAHPPREGGLNE